METLESSRVCRLCGKQSGISINIFDKNESHVKKINAVLPIMVHEMDLLPKHMCHRCSYRLEEFHKFYVDCLKTDAALKSQLSWMSTAAPKERVGIPMVHIENVKIKIEPLDYDAYMNPMDDNVNYINSMSSVTFQSNDIPYATYARCRWCCDKMDQSNRTVQANYETTIASKCNRIGEVEANGSGRADELQAVKKNVTNKVCQERSYAITHDKRNNEEPRNNRLTSSSFDRRDDVRATSDANKEASRSTVVRNLRPRKGSVNYVGTRKKTPSNLLPKREKLKIPQQSTFDTTWIKTEKVDDYEGRTLRPRKGTINYWGTKRKYTKSTYKKESPRDVEDRTFIHKVRNIANELKLPFEKNREVPEDKVQLLIKEEQISDLEDTVCDKSISFTGKPKNRKASSLGNRTNKIDALPRDFLNVRNDRINYSVLNCTQQDTKFGVANDLKFSKSVPQGKSKSRKVDSDRIASVSHSSEHPRNRDGELRSGKIRKLDAAKVLTKKLQRTLRNITDGGKTTNREVMKTISGIVSKQEISTLMKFNDSNIKHYCEDCNTRFLNKELLKLHACYR